MKHGFGNILHAEQESYLERMLPPRDALLREMEALAGERDVPISDPEVGRLLQALACGACGVAGGRMVEVGTAIGYGTLCLARGAPASRVISVDLDPDRLGLARGYLARGGVADRVELLQGAALARLAALAGPFDLAYLDGPKTEYRRTLDLLLPKLRVGGFVVVDNLLWGGRIAAPDPDSEDDADTAALRAFNGYFMSHPQLAAILLPLGDGVGLATKTKPLITEMGGPF
ncbi:MAG TPA: O-methyltransferase [Thermoanaerobaculia bacterium]|jgi:predicted O-methyltransferase YrrM